MGWDDPSYFLKVTVLKLLIFGSGFYSEEAWRNLKAKAVLQFRNVGL